MALRVVASEYAQHVGYPAYIIRRAIRQGIFKKDANGKLDVAECDRRLPMVQYAGPKRRKLATIGSKGGRKKKSPLPNATIDPDEITANKEMLAAIREGQDEDQKTYNDARLRQAVKKAEKDEIEVEALRGTLVNRGKLLLRVQQLARTFRESWVNWPNRVSADIAAELGLEHRKVLAVLEKHVRKNLKDQDEIAIDLGRATGKGR